MYNDSEIFDPEVPEREREWRKYPIRPN